MHDPSSTGGVVSARPEPIDATSISFGAADITLVKTSKEPLQAVAANPTATLGSVEPAEGSTPSHQTVWKAMGFSLDEEGSAGRLPDTVVVFEADGEAGRAALSKFLAGMETPPHLVITLGERQLIVYRLADPSLASPLARSVPPDVTFAGPNDTVRLPGVGEWIPRGGQAMSAAELSELTAVEVSRIARSDVGSLVPAVKKNPLLANTLLGQGALFRAKATEAKPLLANLCLTGQVTIWYAAANTGKTLIALNLLVEAIREKRINPANVFYVNADDSSEGLATKMELMDEVGVYTIVPGFANFKASELVVKLHEMAAKDQARGIFILVDTAKKFAQLMDKKDSSAFGNACRQVAMNGGAVLNLAHTTKSPNADGTPRYTGTTDLVEDADAAYTIARLDKSADEGEHVVEFRCFKRRGDNAESAAYAYAAETGIAYSDRLASVRVVDADALDQFKRVEAQRTDEEVLQVIAACITEGCNVKMLLASEAAARANVSTRAAKRLIEQYTGEDPAQHRWKFTIKARGAKTFELLPPPPP